MRYKRSWNFFVKDWLTFSIPSHIELRTLNWVLVLYIGVLFWSKINRRQREGLIGKERKKLKLRGESAGRVEELVGRAIRHGQSLV